MITIEGTGRKPYILYVFFADGHREEVPPGEIRHRLSGDGWYARVGYWEKPVKIEAWFTSCYEVRNPDPMDVSPFGPTLETRKWKQDITNDVKVSVW